MLLLMGLNWNECLGSDLASFGINFLNNLR